MGRSIKVNVILSSLKMAVATLSSRVLGLVREVVLANTFGASYVTDAFLVAFRLPNVLRDLFAEGAFSSAFIPVFTDVKQRSMKEAQNLLWSSFILLGSITFFFVIVIVIFPVPLIKIFSDEKFYSDPARFKLTVDLVRLMAPFLTFVSLAALFMGVLNTLKIFFIPALAPASFNIVMIVSIIYLPQYLQELSFERAMALGVGVLIGGVVQFAFQIPLILKAGLGPTRNIKIWSKDTKRIVHRLGIGTMGIAATQINILITTILATGTVVGAVSWLNYAFRLFQFPVGIIGVSIASSNLVHFSEHWKKGEREKALESLNTGLILSSFSILPAFALLYVLAEQSIHLVLERGAFSISDTQMTARSLEMYLYGLPFYALYKIFAPTFFAIDRPGTPVKISALSIAFNILFCLWATPKYGFQALALGTSLSMMVNVFLQILMLRKYLDLPLGFFFPLRVGKFVIGAAACALCSTWFKGQFFSFHDSFFMKLSCYGAAVCSGALTYVGVVLVLGEFKLVQRILRRK